MKSVIWTANGLFLPEYPDGAGKFSLTDRTEVENGSRENVLGRPTRIDLNEQFEFVVVFDERRSTLAICIEPNLD